MDFKAKDLRHEGSTLFRQCQLTQLYLLDVFKEICEAYKLRYFLSYGTLLGAARHGAAIPWDDDVDVSMPSRDYRRFLKIAPKVLPEYLMLQTPATVPGCFEYFAKLRDRRTTFLEVHTYLQRPCGIYIDIFPCERLIGLPPKLRRLWVGARSYTWRKNRKHRILGHYTCLGVWGSAILATFFSCAHFWLTFGYKIMAFFLRGNCWGATPECGDKIFFETEMLFPFSEIMYEGKLYSAPHDVEAYLKRCYGDWRMLPPEEQRHGVHAYKVDVDHPIPSKWSYPKGRWRM